MSENISLKVGGIKIKVNSECVIRPTGQRAYQGETVEVSREEYERLLRAKCVSETETTAPAEAACRQGPECRRTKKR